MLRKSFVNFRKLFFVDTSIMLNYSSALSGDDADVKNFIEDPGNIFYFTETVKKRLLPNYQIPKEFKFYHSELTLKQKHMGVILFHELWHHDKSFNQIKGLKGELFIIFEASKSCSGLGILSDNIPEISLLTNNIDLIGGFLSTSEAKNVLETTINLSDFEYLVPILSLDNSIDEWLKSKK